MCLFCFVMVANRCKMMFLYFLSEYFCELKLWDIALLISMLSYCMDEATLHPYHFSISLDLYCKSILCIASQVTTISTYAAHNSLMYHFFYLVHYYVKLEIVNSDFFSSNENEQSTQIVAVFLQDQNTTGINVSTVSEPSSGGWGILRLYEVCTYEGFEFSRAVNLLTHLNSV